MKDYCKGCIVKEKGIFSSLLRNQKNKISCIMDLHRYRKKQILFLEGNPNHHIYAIKSGIVKIFKTTEGGKDHILKILNDGNLMAFDATYSNEYNYSAEVIEDSEICMMKKDDFISLLKEDADLAIEIIKILTRELEEARCSIRDLTTKTAFQKVAWLLLSLPNIFSSANDLKRTITLPLSRKELSDMLGLSPETLSRILSQFEQDNIVKISGKKILVLAPRKLASI